MKIDKIIDLMQQYDSCQIGSEMRSKLGAKLDDIAEQLKDRDIKKIVEKYAQEKLQR